MQYISMHAYLLYIYNYAHCEEQQLKYISLERDWRGADKLPEVSNRIEFEYKYDYIQTNPA